MGLSLNEQVKFIKVKDHSTADTTDVNSDTVDLQASGGWDGAMFLTSYGTAAANNLMHCETSDDDSSWNDLAGGEIDLGGASDEDQWLDVYGNKERYIRVVAQRGTSSTLESVWAILYRGRSLPYSNLTIGTICGKALVSPAEGTK